MVRWISLQHVSFAWTGWSINGADEHLLSHNVSLQFATHYNISFTDGKPMVSKWHDVITFICNCTCKLKHWWINQEMLYHKNISPQYECVCFPWKSCFPSRKCSSDTGWIYYFAIDMLMPNAIWKWLWIDPVFFFPKEKQRMCKLRRRVQQIQTQGALTDDQTIIFHWAEGLGKFADAACC